MNTLKESVEVVADPWKQSTYYDDAEKWTIVFWSEDHPFYPLFKRLDLTAVLELACGHGRHSEIVAERSGQLTLMDVHEQNIEYCRTRLARFQNIVFFTNSGHDFRPIADGALTAIFCYDAMVHFSPDLVQAYLRDTARVLKPGGMALYHHSNYPAPLDRHYGQNPHARNHMTESLFRQFTDEAGLALVESLPIEWGGVADLDRLTLLRK